MVRNDANGKLKSARRKPLRNISNGGVKSLKSTAKKMKFLDKDPQNQQHTNSDEDPLDRLLLLHSEISSTFSQIDELVVQAVNVNTIDSERMKEIKSFTSVLSDIHSSLKPWIPRLGKALASSHTEPQIQIAEPCVESPPVAKLGDEHAIDTPMPTKYESLVSPSPLVSWRATGCLEDRGKQLFLLTPLLRPKTTISKTHASSKLTTLERVSSSLTAKEKSNCEKVEVVFESLETTSDVGLVSAQKKAVGDSSTVLSTPCLKNPPSRNFVFHEPSHNISYKTITKSHKSTPFPIGNKTLYDSTDSETSSGQVPNKLGLKFPELIGINTSYLSKNGTRALDASPAWMMSPPKCCTLLEPRDEKKPKHGTDLHELPNTFNQQLCLARTESNINDDKQDKENKKVCLPGNTKSNVSMVTSTPLWKGSASTICRSKRPAGENTLKRELWERFEAASTDGCRLNFGVFNDDFQKGFLERLEEASDDESNNKHSDALR
ncbi:unnamed protein product [Amaranthus hypochondriacus]